MNHCALDCGRLTVRLAPAVLLAVMAGCTPTMQEQVSKSIGTLSHVQAGEQPVDPDVFAKAKGVAIIDEFQWATVIGHTAGSGVLVRRQDNGTWSPPCAIKAGGLTIGLSAGGEGRSMVVIFQNEDTLDRFVGKGSYFLANAQGAFGTAYGTTGDAVADSEGVHAYVVGEGVFASAALGGASFSIDDKVNEATYGEKITAWDILDGKVTPPPGAGALARRLDRMANRVANGTATAAATKTSTTPAAPPAANAVESKVEVATQDEPASSPKPPEVVR